MNLAKSNCFLATFSPKHSTIVCYALGGWDVAPNAVSGVSHSILGVWVAKTSKLLLVFNNTAVVGGSVTVTVGALPEVTSWNLSSSTIGADVGATRIGLGTHF